jgi:hypothetical protein
MEITTSMIGFVGLGTVAVIAIVLAWPRRRPARANRFGGRPTRSPEWFSSDPVLFTGDAGSADCGAGSDGGGGSCD